MGYGCSMTKFPCRRCCDSKTAWVVRLLLLEERSLLATDRKWRWLSRFLTGMLILSRYDGALWYRPLKTTNMRCILCAMGLAASAVRSTYRCNMVVFLLNDQHCSCNKNWLRGCLATVTVYKKCSWYLDCITTVHMPIYFAQLWHGQSCVHNVACVVNSTTTSGYLLHTVISAAWRVKKQWWQVKRIFHREWLNDHVSFLRILMNFMVTSRCRRWNLWGWKRSLWSRSFMRSSATSTVTARTRALSTSNSSGSPTWTRERRHPTTVPLSTNIFSSPLTMVTPNLVSFKRCQL